VRNKRHEAREPDLEPASAPALSRLSHGLRTPLSLIVGYAELLTMRRDEQTLGEAPQRILEAAEQLTGVVDDLLTVYAIDANVLFVAPVSVELEPLLQGAVEAALARAAQPVTADVEQRARPARVLADPEYLVEIVGTLLENAANRSAEGATIALEARVEDDFARVEIRDDGTPLSDEERASAFDRFSALVPAGGRTTGLELYKARRLVELQGGRVWAESDDSGQTRFGFALPLATEQVG
jgi:signal transduction histidine kinase